MAVARVIVTEAIWRDVNHNFNYKPNRRAHR